MTLLPPNATQSEIALDESIARISDIDVPIISVWDPQTCPEALLPWLAWALSVDVWNPDWPVSVKRNVIAASFEVHLKKGTPNALLKALQSLDLDGVSITEWFEQAGTPGTFSVDVELSTRGLDENASLEIDATIENAKNARSHLDQLNIWLTSSGQLPVVGMFALTGEIIEVLPHSISEVSSETAAPYHAVSAITVETITVNPQEI